MTAEQTELAPDAVEDGSSDGIRAVARERISDLLQVPAADGERGYERSPVAVLRLLASLAAMVVVVALGELLPATHDGLETDLHSHAGSWAVGIGHLGGAIAAGMAVALLVVSLVAGIVARRPRQLATSALAGVVAAAVVAVAARAGGLSGGVVTGEEWQLATVAAAIAFAGASLSIFSAPISRWSVRVIGVATVVGALGSDISLIARILVLLTGAALGAAVAASFGTASRRVTAAELAEGLDRAKRPVDRLEPHPGDARGSQPWRARLLTGREVFVKVMAVDELTADRLFRMWRRVRLRDAEDERSPGSVRRAAEHEAFVALRAQAAGVRTPDVIAVGTLGADGERGAFTMFGAVDGVTLDEVPDGPEPAVLRDAWSQIQILRRSGIAHRDLRAANLLFAGGEVWVIDFGFAEVAASEEMLERDIAELLVSTTAVVGAEAAVEAAVAVLGPDDVATAIPWIQPLAVSRASRAAVHRHTFADLRERVRAASGLPAPELPQLQRVSWKGVLSIAALGIAIWTLLPQMAEGLDLDVVAEAQRGWALAALVASAVTYVGAAVAIRGSVGGAVPLGSTTAAQLASSFTNRVTPARVGGMALNVRFLIQQGIEQATAVTGVAVSTAAGTVAHVAITLVAILWAGNAGFPAISMPSSRVLLVIGGVALVAAAVSVVVPALRHWYVRTVFPALRRSFRSFVEVIRSPWAMVMVLGGSATVTLMNVAAFGVSLRAFGESVPWATLAVVYLAGSALASAAPTPGGLGATEAALVAGLAVVGVSEGPAVAGVLLFRLATFWLPILPGWLAFLVLQRRGDV